MMVQERGFHFLYRVDRGILAGSKDIEFISIRISAEADGAKVMRQP